MNIEIYSKDACGQCIQAKTLIKNKGCSEYKEYILGKDASLQELQLRVTEANSGKPVRSAPQIFIDGEHIGEYRDLVAFLATSEGCSV